MFVPKIRRGFTIVEAMFYWFMLLVAVLIIFSTKGDGESPEQVAERTGNRNAEAGNNNAREIHYFRDPKTGLCFASRGVGITLVPCDKVQDQLLNPELKPEVDPGP